MRVSTRHRGNHSEDPTDRVRLRLLVDRVRRVRLAQLARSDDDLAASVALLAASVDRLLAEIRRLERRP